MLSQCFTSRFAGLFVLALHLISTSVDPSSHSWSKMEVEALIEAVRRRQVLYDKADDDYSNRVVINQKWKEVAEEVGTDDATARKKWAVLRDSFRKHHKKETTFKSGSGGKGQRKWYLYNNLLFLLPFVDDRSTSTTNNLVEGLESESQQASVQLENILDDDFSLASPVDASQPGPSCTPVTIQTRTPLRKTKRPYPQERPGSLSPFDVEMLSALKGMQQERKALQDDDEHFLLSLLPVMKSLDPVSKFELRGDINATALRYLRRAQQQSPYRGQGHPSRTSTPVSQQSPSSVTTEDYHQYSQYQLTSAQIHHPPLQDSQYTQSQQLYMPTMLE